MGFKIRNTFWILLETLIEDLDTKFFYDSFDDLCKNVYRKKKNAI